MPVVAGIIVVVGLVIAAAAVLGQITFTEAAREAYGERANVLDAPPEAAEGFRPGDGWDAAVVAALLVGPVAVFGLVLAIISPLWRVADRLVLIAAVPVAVVVLAGLPELGFALAEATGVTAGVVVAAAVVLAGGGWLVWSTTKYGLARARAILEC